jgi:hypothetical protein
MDAFRQFALLKASRQRLLRALFVLLVLANFGAVQIHSATEFHAHQHGGPNDHCCPGCHGGHFPMLQAVGTVDVAGVSVSAWWTVLHEAASLSRESFPLSSPRAPPV